MAPQMILYFKLIGKLPTPCLSMMEWALWFEHAYEERIVGQTQVGPIEVSTVFIGLDHSFGYGRPKLFETIAFCGEVIVLGRLLRDSLNYQERYETWDEAEKGHQRACEWAKQQLEVIDADIAKSHPGVSGPGGGGTQLDQDT